MDIMPLNRLVHPVQKLIGGIKRNDMIDDRRDTQFILDSSPQFSWLHAGRVFMSTVSAVIAVFFIVNLGDVDGVKVTILDESPNAG